MPADLTGFVPLTELSPSQRQVIKPSGKTAVKPKHPIEPSIEHLLNDSVSPDLQDLEADVKTETYLPLEAEEEMTAIQLVTSWKQAGRAQKWTNLCLAIDHSKYYQLAALAD
jgi:hypothetical protein